MNQNIVKITLHGLLGEAIGKEWNLAVKTFSAALNAVETLSKRKFYKFLREKDAEGVRYQILINGREFLHDKSNPPDISKPESIVNTELCGKTKNLETIDIVPVIEGAGGDIGNIFTIILGVILIAVGIFVPGLGAFGVALVLAGLGLIAAGVINLLSKGPELQEFKDRQKTSYLFSGPVNTVGEGGVVPVGYGELLIGSAVISASYDVGYFDAGDNTRTVNS